MGVRDVEVVFDLPSEAHNGGRPLAAAGRDHRPSDEVHPDVRRLRHAVVTDLESGNGSAVEALELLEPHRAHPADVLTSALLVCSHRRYERCSRTLMRELAAGGLLDDEQLDELAGALLWEDRARFAVPSTWISTWLEVPPGTRVRASGREVVVPDPDEQTFPHVQRIPAAARRWAARRLLERGHTDVDAVLARVDDLEDGEGGAVLCGALDAWAACRPEELEPALRAALARGASSVRLRGLDVLARTGRAEEAVAIARDDGAATVRTWQPPADRRARTPDQPTLLG
jgi:hypothetical protein